MGDQLKREGRQGRLRRGRAGNFGVRQVFDEQQTVVTADALRVPGVHRLGERAALCARGCIECGRGDLNPHGVATNRT